MFLTVSQASSSNPILISIAFGLVGFLVHRGLYLYGFFQLPIILKDSRVWTLTQTLSCFGIYFINSFVFIPIVYEIVSKTFSYFDSSVLAEKKTQMLALQAVYVTFNLLLLGIYLYFQDKNRVSSIWKDPLIKRDNSYLYDILIGFSTWFVAFPIIVAVNTLCEYIIDIFAKAADVEQVAVKFLKINSNSFFPLMIVLFMIIVSAPLIEEFLFRGCLQNYLRKKYGVKVAIIVTSLFFSAMHFAVSQSLSNISLILSLFVFSIYLGFVYEKTRSLLSCITLHMTFNAISAVRIVFFN